MNSPDMEEWRKAQRIKKCKMARLNEKLVVGARRLYKQNMREDGEVERYKSTCHLRVLTGRRGALHGEDTFGDGSG